MSWQEVVVQIIIPVGIFQIFIKWGFGFFLCSKNLGRRVKEVSVNIERMSSIYTEDFARRGLSSSGFSGQAQLKCRDMHKEIRKRLERLKWFGNDIESERILDNLKNEAHSLALLLDQRFYKHNLNDILGEIKHILGNSEVLQSPLQRRTGSYRND